MGASPGSDLFYLRNMIRKLPGGNTIYDDLLETLFDRLCQASHPASMKLRQLGHWLTAKTILSRFSTGLLSARNDHDVL